MPFAGERVSPGRTWPPLPRCPSVSLHVSKRQTMRHRFEAIRSRACPGHFRELGEMSQLRFAFLLSDVDMGCGVEEDSIDRADLLGDVVRSDGWFSGSDYPNEVTPFADYLCKLAEDLEIEGIVDFSPAAPPDVISTVGYFTIWGAEPHRVCGERIGRTFRRFPTGPVGAGVWRCSTIEGAEGIPGTGGQEHSRPVAGEPAER